MSSTRESILDRVRQLEPTAVWSMASITTNGRPWVRYITPPAVDDDLVIWGNTLTGTRKLEQTAVNLEVHLTVGVKDLGTDITRAAQGTAWPCVPDPIRHFRGPGGKSDVRPRITLKTLLAFSRLPAGQ